MPKFTFDFVLDLEEVGDKVASMYPLLFTDNKYQFDTLHACIR